MSTTTANRGSSGVSRLAMMQARFQAKQLADRENKLINFLEERQEAAVRRINANREANHSANSFTSSSYSSSNNSINAPGRPRTTLSRRVPPQVEKSSPIGWDKSYPLKPVVTPIGYASNHHLPPARPPPAYGESNRINGGGGVPKFNKYSGNYGPKSRGASLDRSYSELQRAQRQLYLSRTKSSNQLIPGPSTIRAEDEFSIQNHNARNRLRTRRSSSGAIYRGGNHPEEEWYDETRRATSSYTREYVRNLPTSIPNSSSFVMARTRSQTRPVGRCLSSNTNTDSGLEQSSYSSQSSDRSDFMPPSNQPAPGRPIVKDPFTVIRPSRSHNQLARIVKTNEPDIGTSLVYDLPPRSNKINTKTYRKNRNGRSMSRSPEPSMYSSHSKINTLGNKIEDEDPNDDENMDPRRALQEQRALLIRKNQEQKQLQEEMQQREKELLRKIQEQQKELELVKKNQTKVASVPSNGVRERRNSKPSKPELTNTKSNSRRISTEDLPEDNLRIDRNYLRRKNREDSSSNWDLPSHIQGRNPESTSIRVNDARRESSNNRAELHESSKPTKTIDHLSEGSKTLPSRRKSSTGSSSPIKKASVSNLSGSTTSLNQQSRRSVFTPKVRDDLDQCPNCSRNFASDRIEKHVSICSKNGKKKRKAFDMTRKRVQGTEAEVFLKRASKNKKPQKEPKKVDWRKKREEFIAALRAAKEAQRHLAAGGKISDLPPPPPSDTSDYIQCPHCNRRFNEAVAERHIPKCKDIKCNKKR